MFREWWELKDGETRILSLYRRFDAVCRLPAGLSSLGLTGVVKEHDLEQILEEVGTLCPETALDFMAQSVMLASVDRIFMATGQRDAYSKQLEAYIESEGELCIRPEIQAMDDTVCIWTRYWGVRTGLAANRPAGDSATLAHFRR